MAQVDRVNRRTTFDAVAERYDRRRPAYPSAVFDAIDQFAGLEPGSRVLEVGCGTGHATVALARRGYEVLAVELGANMADVARRNLAPYPNARVVVADFERWEPPPQPFDALVSASAFHWIDPETRYAKAADALGDGGTLAVIAVDHVMGGTEAFFHEVEACYARWDPDTAEPGPPPAVADVPTWTDEFDGSGRFGPVTVQRFDREVDYTSAEYLELLMTFSGHLVLDPEAQAGLLDCIRGLIDDRYGGSITKRDVVTLSMARSHR
jgi:SAM-dependent methyltransferase